MKNYTNSDYQPIVLIQDTTGAPNDADLSLIEVYPTEDGQNIDDNINILELATREEISNAKIGDKDYGTLWKSDCKITSFGGNFINYDAFIVGGNSGSPLFNENNKVIGLSNASDGEVSDKVISFGFLLT